MLVAGWTDITTIGHTIEHFLFLQKPDFCRDGFLESCRQRIRAERLHFGQLHDANDWKIQGAAQGKHIRFQSIRLVLFLVELCQSVAS